MKLISPLSVFVGVIPGAFPFMIGWVAATNEIGIEALTLFLMQFFGSSHIFGQSDGLKIVIMKSWFQNVTNWKKRQVHIGTNFVLFDMGCISFNNSFFWNYQN